MESEYILFIFTAVVVIYAVAKDIKNLVKNDKKHEKLY